MRFLLAATLLFLSLPIPAIANNPQRDFMSQHPEVIGVGGAFGEKTFHVDFAPGTSDADVSRAMMDAQSFDWTPKPDPNPDLFQGKIMDGINSGKLAPKWAQYATLLSERYAKDPEAAKALWQKIVSDQSYSAVEDMQAIEKVAAKANMEFAADMPEPPAPQPDPNGFILACSTDATIPVEAYSLIMQVAKLYEIDPDAAQKCWQISISTPRFWLSSTLTSTISKYATTNRMPLQ